MSDSPGLTFRLTVGLLNRGEAKRAIIKYCFDVGLQCAVREERGLLSSDYYFEIRGPSAKLNAAWADIEAWIRRNSTQEEKA